MPTRVIATPYSNPVEFFVAWTYMHFYNRDDVKIRLKKRKTIEKYWQVFVGRCMKFSGNDYSYILPMIDWDIMEEHNKKMYRICRNRAYFNMQDPYYDLLINYGLVHLY